MTITPEQAQLALRIAAAAGLVFWLLVALDRKRWWPLQWSLHLEGAATQPRPGELGEVSIVVPARNEASTLPRTLPRLLKQSDWCYRIVVIDDRSGDQTGAAAQRLGEGHAAWDKLHVVRAATPPEGWSGKPHAMHTGLQLALDGWTGDPEQQWLLFTDADILHPTTSIARLLTKAAAEDYDCVSVMVKLRARSFWEWLLIPPFMYFFQLMYPFRRASDPRSRVAAAAGGCVLVRRRALEQIDGFDRIKGRVIDDIALVRQLKRSGARCWLGLDPDLTSLRTYVNIGEIVRLVARTAFEQLGHRYLLVPVVTIALLLFFTAPPLLAAYGAATVDPIIAAPAAIAWLLQWANFIPVVQYLGVPTGFAVTLPLAALVYAYATVLSAWRHATGKGVPWREPVEVDNTDEG